MVILLINEMVMLLIKDLEVDSLGPMGTYIGIL